MAPHSHSDMDMSGSDMSGMSDMPSMSGHGMDMKMYFHGSIGDDMFLFQSWMPTSAGAVAGIAIAVFILAVFERYLAAVRRACDSSWRRGFVGLSLPRASGTHHYTHQEPRVGSITTTSTPVQKRSTNTTPAPGNCCAPSIDDDDPEAILSANPDNDNDNDGDTEVDEYAELDKKLGLNPASGHLPRAARMVENPMRTQRWSRPFQWGVDIPRGLLQALQTALHYILMLTAMTFQIYWIIAIVIGSGVGEVLFGRFGSGHTGCG